MIILNRFPGLISRQQGWVISQKEEEEEEEEEDKHIYCVFITTQIICKSQVTYFIFSLG